MNEKISFFRRVKISIFKLEDYEKFISEKLSKCIKYFLIVVVILSCVLAFISAYDFSKLFDKGMNYYVNEFPEFSFSDDKLYIDEYVEGYDEEYEMYIIADTSENVDENKLNEYKNKILTSGIILLQDKAIYKYAGSYVEYKYADMVDKYGLSISDKQSIVDKVYSIGKTGITATVFAAFLLVNFVVESLSVFLDCLVIALFAWCVSKICRVRLSFKQNIIISVYALTLPIILSILYNIANYCWGFQTEYFRTVYLLISYVYVIAVILMIKSDIITQTVEIQKIEKEQEKIHEEMEKEEENKDDVENDNKENDDVNKNNEDNNPVKNNEESDDGLIKDNREPDGSEI